MLREDIPVTQVEDVKKDFNPSSASQESNFL
jgi:hypothetical protein